MKGIDNNMKQLTVLMTTYNENKHILIDAIESILNQTYKGFEFIIIVDNPNNSENIEVLNWYAESDQRIKIIINNENLGLPLSLNKGINLVETKYLARMDADDIALPTRFEKQINFLEEHPEVSLVGSNIIYINYEGIELYKRGSIATKYTQLKKIAKYMNMFNHPTLMGKTSVFKKYKYRNLKYSQDYDLTCRMLEDNEIIENLPDYLLKYRLPLNEQIEKKVQQKLTMHIIQSAYRKKNLKNIHIMEKINNDMRKVNQKKVVYDIKKYDLILSLIRQKNFYNAIIEMIRLSVDSRVMRKDMYNLVKFACWKMIYRF